MADKSIIVESRFPYWQDASTLIQTLISRLPGVNVKVKYRDGWYYVSIKAPNEAAARAVGNMCELSRSPYLDSTQPN